jgi:hypothetical protein
MNQAKATVHDGIIDGKVDIQKHFCDYCDMGTMTVIIDSFSMPEGIEPQATILGRIITRFTDRPAPTPPFRSQMRIGIGCGCYAKFHRQVAHIQSKMESRKNAKRRTESRV